MIKKTSVVTGLVLLLSSPIASTGHFQVDGTEFTNPPAEEKPVDKIEREPIKFIANVSAYSPTSDECGKDDGITASGRKAVEGRTIACDGLPLGTHVYIEGMGEYIVEDRFGGNYGMNRIDIYMDDTNDCWKFGRRELEVTIL